MVRRGLGRSGAGLKVLVVGLNTLLEGRHRLIKRGNVGTKWRERRGGLRVNCVSGKFGRKEKALTSVGVST